MQLTFEEIKKITVGAVRVEQQEEGICTYSDLEI